MFEQSDEVPARQTALQASQLEHLEVWVSASYILSLFWRRKGRPEAATSVRGDTESDEGTVIDRVINVVIALSIFWLKLSATISISSKKMERMKIRCYGF